MPIRPVAKKFYAIRYDGMNSSDVLPLFEFNGWTASITSEVGGVLTIHSDTHNVDFVINTGDWCYNDKEVPDSHGFVVTNTVFNELFFKTDISVGFAAVPTLLLSQSATVSVTLEIPFLDTNYSAVALITGSLNLLGALQVNSVTVIDEDTVNVVVQNTGLVTLSGASVLVVATRN